MAKMEWVRREEQLLPVLQELVHLKLRRPVKRPRLSVEKFENRSWTNIAKRDIPKVCFRFLEFLCVQSVTLD